MTASRPDASHTITLLTVRSNATIVQPMGKAMGGGHHQGLNPCWLAARSEEMVGRRAGKGLRGHGHKQAVRHGMLSPWCYIQRE